MEQKGFWDANPKTTFLTGLFLGVSVSSIIALISILCILMNGGFATGAVAVGTAPTPVAAQPTDPVPSVPSKPVAAVTDKDHIRGAKNAKVTLIEYSDFECPFCERLHPSLQQALKEFPNDVRLIYRNYPLSFHPNAQKAAEAAECVNKIKGNDAYWQMHDKLFANTTKLSPALYPQLAKEVGVDEAAFKKCLDSGETASFVAEQTASGNDSGVEGTPATFVNGTLVSGAVPYETLKAAIVAAGAKN
ncbi:thioredoxin domain-containing protein [Patescibacteria group bacterium]|nr:thioredoxin domain-containing protein [Patescibacteria group bacterium]